MIAELEMYFDDKNNLTIIMILQSPLTWVYANLLIRFSFYSLNKNIYNTLHDP
jgi:hypothetical protein